MLTVRRLVWEETNIAHIAIHDVVPEEVEQLCHGPFIVGAARLGRLILIGPTASGRMLAAILDPEPEPDVYYPVSARSASRKERRRYLDSQGGDTP
jgi:uncharacterized DUF497 family protein